MLTIHKPITQVDVERGIVTPESVTNQQASLTGRAVHSEVLEYYSYRAVVTVQRPVFALLKCKASKVRPIDEEFGEECSFIHFGAMEVISLGGMHFGRLNMTSKLFQDIRCGLNSQRVIEVCERVCNWQTAQRLHVGDVFALKTDAGKAGLMHIEGLGDNYVQVAACHFIV